jgi:hypothetical protein
MGLRAQKRRKCEEMCGKTHAGPPFSRAALGALIKPGNDVARAASVPIGEKSECAALACGSCSFHE